MALSDRKMPIIEGINDAPSITGNPSHPNGALMCQKYNALIDNELTTIQNNLPATTDDLTEGTTNKYYTDTRFDTRLATKTTDNLAEGTNNKYFTNTASRASISLTAGTSGATYNSTTGVIDLTNLQAGISDLNDFNTDDLVEGTTNKYYSNTLSREAISISAGTTGITYNSTTGVLDFTNLQVGITDLISFTTDDLVEGTTNKYIDANTVKKNEQNVYTKSQTVQTVSLVDGANIAVDASLGNVFSITLAGDRTIDNPTNLESGQLLIFKVTQDSTGTRLLTWDTAYKFSNDTPPTLTTTANKVDIISCVSDGTNLYCDAKLNF